MRSKLNATLVLSFAGLVSIATACGDDGASPGGGDAGESGAGAGTGGSMTTGGSKGGGTAGKTSSDGGDPSGGGGVPSGTAGEPSGDAGHGTTKGGQGTADGGEPSGDGGMATSNGGAPTGNGGEPSGNGGEPSGEAGAGGSGPVGCTAVTLAAFGQAQTTENFALYAAAMTPNILGAGSDVVRLSVIADPYDGAATGTFDLTQNGDDNYKTCSRCFTARADDNGGAIFYASEGTLTIEAGSKQLGGTIDATVTNLKLIEVTIANDLTSTPVPGGACITVASATIEVEAPPCEEFECDNGYCIENAAWTCDRDPDCADGSDEAPANTECAPLEWVCPLDYYEDGDCDCGCGAKDPVCANTTDPAECDYCTECQGNFQLCVDANVDPADTTQCAP